MPEEEIPTPDFLWSLLTMKCPRCRRGDMFVHKHPFKKLSLDYMLEMHDHCHECSQRFELETGFWYGTGYVSYGLTVAISAFTFVLWWLIIGFSFNDDRLIYWLIFNGALVIITQPWLMRISRVLYLYLFVKYNPNYKNEEGVRFT